MLDRPALSAYSFLTFDAAATYIRRPTVEDQEQGDDDLLVFGLNAVTGLFRQVTGRRLAARTYRAPVAVNITTQSQQAAVTGAGFSALKTLDDATHVGLPAGTRIRSIESDTQMTLAFAHPANGPITAGALAGVAFGSRPLRLDGDLERVIYIPETPVQELYAVYAIDSQGARVALDLAGHSLDRDTGRLVLRQDVFWRGSLTIEIECKAGYLKPAPGVLGDEEWGDLEQLFGRALQVMFQDWKRSVGRAGSGEFMGMKQKIDNFKLPEDIAEGLDRYRARAH